MSSTVPGWPEVEQKLLIRKTSSSKNLWRDIHRKAVASFTPEGGERALAGVVAYVHDGFDEARSRPGAEVTVGDLVVTTHRLMFINEDMIANLVLRDFDTVSGAECKVGLLKRTFAIRAREGADETVWTGVNSASARSFFETLEGAHAWARDSHGR